VGEVAVDEVSVGLQRERGGVVAHPALQAQRAQPGLDQHRRTGVAQRVEADASEAGARGGGDQDAAAQAALVGRAALSTGEHEAVVPHAGRTAVAQQGGQLARQWLSCIAGLSRIVVPRIRPPRRRR
jgi:hypothetical protein